MAAVLIEKHAAQTNCPRRSGHVAAPIESY